MKKYTVIAALIIVTALSLTALPLRSVSEGFYEYRSHGLTLWGFQNSLIITPEERPPLFLTPSLTVYPERLLPGLEAGSYIVWADRSYSRLAYKVTTPFEREPMEPLPLEHQVSFDITQESASQILTLGLSSSINTDRFTASLYLASRWTGPVSRFGIRSSGWVTSTEGIGASVAADWDLFTANPLGWNLGITAGTYRREDQTELRGADITGRTALVVPLSRGRVIYQISLGRNPDFWLHNHTVILDLSL